MTSWIFPAPSTLTGTEPSASGVLSITLEMHDANTVLLLDGPVCAYTAPHLDAELRQIEAVDRHRLVVDASRVHTLTSDGLEVLVEHAARCAAAGGELVVRNPSPLTSRVLAVCGLEWLAERGPVSET